MRTMLALTLLAVLILPTGCSDTNASAARDGQLPHPGPVLRHVVLFKFKDASTPADVQRCVDTFRALPAKIELIKGFEWGTNNSPEPHDHGLTHAFLLTFATEADRDAYLPHPAHKQFGQIAGPHLDKITVVDYWAQQ